MKRRFMLAIVALAVLAPAAMVLHAAQPAGKDNEKDKQSKNAVVWLTSYKQAREQSKATGRPILADFTGSDWCPACIQLRDDVLDTKDFLAWARERFVLLEVDFPNDKPQSAEIKKQNRDLAERHNVEYFPTVLVLDPGEHEVGRIVGYRGKDWWMERAKALAAKAPATQPAK